MGGRIFDVTFDSSALDRVRFRLGDMEKRAPSVMANALNQTQTQLKKEISKHIPDLYTYKRKIKVPRVKRASYKNLEARLFYTRRNEGIEHFDFKPGRHGLPRSSLGERFSVKIFKGSGYKDIYAAFSGKPMGKKIIFHRNSEEERLAAKARNTSGKDYKYELRKLVGPSEHSMVKSVWNEGKVQQGIGKNLQENLDYQINEQFLKKWGGK